MSPTYAKKGSRLLLAGARVRIDPGLQTAEGLPLVPVNVFAARGGLVASIQSDGTFDLQNLTLVPQEIDYYAEYTHSIQFNAQEPSQTSLGPLGADPSPLPPLPFPGGSLGGTLRQLVVPFAFDSPSPLPLLAPFAGGCRRFGGRCHRDPV